MTCPDCHCRDANTDDFCTCSCHDPFDFTQNPLEDEIRNAREDIERHVEAGECPKCGNGDIIVYDYVPQILKDLGEFPTPYRCGDRDCGRFFHDHRRPDHGDDEKRFANGS